MSPRASDDWLFRQIDSLRQLVTDQHSRLREDMQESFSELRRDMRTHEAFDVETRQRIDKVITQREEEEKTAIKRSTWVAMVISGGATIIAEIIRHASSAPKVGP